MGGGVIIKPALDALGIMQVAEINFLSGCTVLGMTCWSVGKSMVQHESQIDLSISTPLAIGAAVGGMAGKQLFSAVAGLLANADTAGGIQAALLCTATFSTLLYTIRKDRLTMLQVRNPASTCWTEKPDKHFNTILLKLILPAFQEILSLTVLWMKKEMCGLAATRIYPAIG